MKLSFNKQSNAVFKGQNITSDPINNDFQSSDDNEDVKIVFMSPETYRSIHCIKPYSVQLDDNNNTIIKAQPNLVISNETINKLLLKPSGELDNMSTIKFIKLYRDNLYKMIEDDKKENDFLAEQLQDGFDFSGVLDTSSDDTRKIVCDSINDRKNVDANELIKDVSSKLNGQTKIDFISNILNAKPEIQKNIPNNAYNLTEILFELSKTKDGYDLTDLDKKNQFVAMYDHLVWNLPNEDSQNITNNFLNELKNNDGSIDIDFALDMVNIVDSCPFAIPTDVLIDSMRTHYKNNPDNKSEIFDIMLKLSTEGNFNWSPSEVYPVLITNQCFDENGKYDALKAQKVMELVEKLNENINEIIEQPGFDFKNYDEVVKNEFENLKYNFN